MNFPLFIARRYFRTKKKKNFISIIANISMGGVAVGSMALIIVLSVFNGLEDLLKNLYGTFDPQIKIEASKGKSFEVNDSLIHSVNTMPGIKVITEVIEDYAYIKYKNAEMAVVLKGVGENFNEQGRLGSALVQGNLKLKDNNIPYAIIGRGIQYALNVDLGSEFESLRLYYVKNLKAGSLDPSSMVNRKSITPSGVFALEKNYDETYVFVPLSFAQELFNYENRRTSLEVKIEEGFSISEVQKVLKETLGDDFKVLNNEEQHASLLRAVKIEKLFVYIIFTFIIAVASFNIFFSLSMLAIDKKKDISVLFAMGASNKVIRSIFLYEGAIIAFSGALLGLILGSIFCLLQQEFGLISMGMESAIILNYPVKMEMKDFIFTALVIISITFFASYRPAVIATRYNNKENLY